MTECVATVAGVLSLLLACSVYGLEFDVQQITIGEGKKVALMSLGDSRTKQTELLVVETPDLNAREKQLLGPAEPTRVVSIFTRSGPKWRLRLRKELDSSMDLIDTMRGRDGVALVGYQNSQLKFLDETSERFLPLLTTESMYVGANWDSSPNIEMFVDLNEDGLDDFLMPGFDGWQVALQTEKGFMALQVVGPPPEMNFGETPEFVGYRAETPYFLDENRDGLEDLAFWLNGQFQIFLQREEGGFASEPVFLDPQQKDLLGGYFSVSLGEDPDDQSDSQRLLDGVEDVDGDGWSDLIIQRIEGDGIFGLETQYEVHRGGVGADRRLSFEAEASSIVSTGGIQLDNKRLDLTGNGSREFVVTSVDINIGTIIGVLLTRSTSVDVSIYQMIDSSFAARPSVKKEITVKFDFSSGELFIPAVLSADVTGDGRQDLLVQKGLDTLLIYPGEVSERLFARSPIKLDLELPKDREGFVVADLDHDGRDELVLHVKREDTSVLSIVEFSD